MGNGVWRRRVDTGRGIGIRVADSAAVIPYFEPPHWKIGPLEIKLNRSGPGHFTTPVTTIPYAGSWKLRLQLVKGEFDEEHTTFTVKIAPRR